MREILFRGKDKKTGMWIYGDLRKRYDDVSYRIASKDPEDMLPSGGYEFVEVEEDTIGQYTGEKDERYRGIYEGDILSIDTDDSYSGTKGIVVYEESAFLVRMVDGVYMGLVSAEYGYDWEIIGNTTDNSEMVEWQKTL